jgi:riboflavin kinase/FMN adenylyltransferase
MGVSITIAVDLSGSFRRMDGLEFLQILSGHGRMAYMALGCNFRCGYRLNTDVTAIQEFNKKRDIETCVVQPLAEGRKTISSSHIRSAITRGKLSEAAFMLGHPFTVDLSGALGPGEAAGMAGGKAIGGDISYNIAGQGRILPPPGRYPVLLFDKNRNRNAGLSTEILIENGCIIISEKDMAPALIAAHEYVEFLPAEKKW